MTGRIAITILFTTIQLGLLLGKLFGTLDISWLYVALPTLIIVGGGVLFFIMYRFIDAFLFIFDR